MTAMLPAGVVADRSALRFHSASRSHVGLVRAINEDRVLDCAERGIWAVVDGMGGHHGGDLAAQAVVDALRGDAVDMLAALAQANRAILTRNTQARSDSGATVAAVQAEGGSARIAWAGDSRVYAIRDGCAHQITHDHSVVQELVDAGLIDAEAAGRHPQSNVVTRALGIHADAGIESVVRDIRDGDRLLLCSDGLSRSLNHSELAADMPIVELADRLIAGALERDGSDNVSLVLIEATRAG